MLDVTEGVDETEETLSLSTELTELTELIVVDLRGVGMEGRLFIVEPRSNDLWDFGGGRGGTESTRASSSLDSLELFALPTIHQSPEGLLSTLIASVLCELTSPVPSTQPSHTQVSTPHPLRRIT